MFFAMAKAALAAALFCLASPAAATGIKTTPNTKKALVSKLKEVGVGRGGMWPKGEVFSFYVDYGDLPPPRGNVSGNDCMVMVDKGDYKNVMCKKPIYADAAKTTTIGKAIYNLQMFYQSTVTNLAEGNYQSVQNIPLVDKTGMTRQLYLNVNGRIEYELIPGAGGYPAASHANLLSLAVSSLEADGIACTNVAITPITTPGVDSITEYIVDARKATCVHQGFIEG